MSVPIEGSDHGTSEGRAFARAGLLGNPSDGYGGRTISLIIRNFEAVVTVTGSTELLIEPHDWPSRRDEMLLTWSTGDRQALILDLATGLERIDEAVAHGRARLDHHWRMDVAGGHFTIEGQSELVEQSSRAAPSPWS